MSLNSCSQARFSLMERSRLQSQGSPRISGHLVSEITLQLFFVFGIVQSYGVLYGCRIHIGPVALARCERSTPLSSLPCLSLPQSLHNHTGFCSGLAWGILT